MKLFKIFALLTVAVLALTSPPETFAQTGNLGRPSTTAGSIGTKDSVLTTSVHYMRLNPIAPAFVKGDKKYLRIDLAVTKATGTVGATIKIKGSSNGTDWEYVNANDSILVTNTAGRKPYSKTYSNSGNPIGWDYYMAEISGTSGTYKITGTYSFK